MSELMLGVAYGRGVCGAEKLYTWHKCRIAASVAKQLMGQGAVSEYDFLLGMTVATARNKNRSKFKKLQARVDSDWLKELESAYGQIDGQVQDALSKVVGQAAMERDSNSFKRFCKHIGFYHSVMADTMEALEETPGEQTHEALCRVFGADSLSSCINNRREMMEDLIDGISSKKDSDYHNEMTEPRKTRSSARKSTAVAKKQGKPNEHHDSKPTKGSTEVISEGYDTEPSLEDKTDRLHVDYVPVPKTPTARRTNCLLTGPPKKRSKTTAEEPPMEEAGQSPEKGRPKLSESGIELDMDDLDPGLDFGVMVIEEWREGERFAPEPDYVTNLIEDVKEKDLAKLASGRVKPGHIYFVDLSRKYSYSMKNAHRGPHQLLDRETANAALLAAKSIRIGVTWIARDEAFFPGENPTVTYASHHTPEYQDVFGDEEINLEEIVRIILRNEEAFESTEDREKDSNNLRGTTNFDGGYSPRSYETKEDARARGDAVAGIRMINMGGDGDRVYEGSGGMLDSLQRYLDKHCRLNGRLPMSDMNRTKEFVEAFQAKTKTTCCRGEAFTVGVSKVGSVEDFRKGKKPAQRTERHVDMPNCREPGYNHTAIWTVYICLCDYVYRVTVILYTRLSCGALVSAFEHA